MADTVTGSVRLPRTEIGRFETAARALGLDRATFLRMALRLGAANVLVEQAGSAYHRGEITLSRAAEIAGISIHELLEKMEQYNLHLNYGLRELEKDLNG